MQVNSNNCNLYLVMMIIQYIRVKLRFLIDHMLYKSLYTCQ